MSATGSYDFAAIEAKWQRYWLENKTFRTVGPTDPGFDAAKPKFYVLDMFPYPSGVGLHVGHPLGYIATDIYARFLRMRGYNVLHPMGYDAFGLPAEQYAVEHGVPPRQTTERNIANMRSQMQRLGLGYDWEREIATTDVTYYKWTQWIFLQLYNSWYDPAVDAARPIAELIHKLEQDLLRVRYDGQVCEPSGRGAESVLGAEPGMRSWGELTPQERQAVLDEYRLAYLDEVPVNWCPALGTVLANEEVTNDGRSERGNHPVFRRPLRQWMLRITAYADRLENDLDLVDWPEPIKLMQQNWIGRSEGAEVDFQIADHEEVIRVYTTRPDTLFGATYMVLAPEHELVNLVTSDAQRAAVQQYVQEARHKTDLDRTADTKEKTGVFTGGYAVNPVNGNRIPIWIADYVLMGYGTGAIMAVPAHDTRDFEFATKFDLPIVRVVQPPAGEDWRGFTGDGVAVNSGPFDGLSTPQFKQRIVEWLEADELGQGAVNYKLRDWLFSRQRYWGEPFPIVHDVKTGEVFPLDESELPVELPAIEDYRPQVSDDPDALPVPPLGRAVDWVNVRGYVTPEGAVKTLKAGQTPPPGLVERTFRRELNTMPQWAVPAGTTCVIRTTTTTGPWSTRSWRTTGWHRPADRARPPAAASISTSAGPSTPCSTCSIRGSGTRSCSTSAMSARRNRSAGCSTRGTSRPTPSRTSGESTLTSTTPKRRSKARRSSTSANPRANPLPAISARWARASRTRSRPTTSATSTAPTPCEPTRCTWGRSRPANPGARGTSSA